VEPRVLRQPPKRTPSNLLVLVVRSERAALGRDACRHASTAIPPMPRWVWPHFPASRYGAARLVRRQGARDFVLRVLAYLIVRTRRARVPCFCFSPELYPLASRSVLTTRSRSARRFTSRTATSTFRRRRRVSSVFPRRHGRGSTQFCSEYTALSGSSRFLLSRQSALYFCGVAGRAEAAACGATALMQEDDFASTGREGALEVVGRAVVAHDYFERRHRLPP
jgi:hypothetical protein